MIKMIKSIRDYIYYQKVKFKELIEYKKALFLWILSNISYFAVGLMSVLFVVKTTSAFPLEVGVLLLITSYLVWDIAHLFIISEGVFNNDIYIYSLTKPFNEIISTLYSLPKRSIIILINFLLLIFASYIYEIPLSWIYFVYVALGVMILSLFINFIYLVSLTINKIDTCPFCYIVYDIQDMLSKYPYTLFINSKLFLIIVSISLANFYTYDPIRALFGENTGLLFLVGSIIVLMLLLLNALFYKNIFLRVFETYGG